MTIKRADEIIERLEILADDNFYPLEENRDYKMLCYLVSKKRSDETIDNDDVMYYYKEIIHDMKQYF